MTRLFVALLLSVVAGMAAGQSMMPAQRDALSAAERWLAPVDKQRYGDAWAMAAESFKGKVPRDAFRDGIAKIRRDYGTLVKRSGEKLAFRGGAPTAEEGDAAMKPGTEIAIMFDATFAGNKQAQEEVTMVLEKDGVWRVAGYYIR